MPPTLGTDAVFAIRYAACTRCGRRLGIRIATDTECDCFFWLPKRRNTGCRAAGAALKTPEHRVSGGRCSPENAGTPGAETAVRRRTKLAAPSASRRRGRGDLAQLRERLDSAVDVRHQGQVTSAVRSSIASSMAVPLHGRQSQRTTDPGGQELTSVHLCSPAPSINQSM